HPDEPVDEQRVPQAELAPDGNNAGAAHRKRKLLARPLPNLHERLGEALELAPRRRQRRAVAVAREKLAAEFLLQRTDAGADGRLGNVKPVRCLEEASCVDDLQKRTGAIYVHTITTVQLFCTDTAFNSVCLPFLSRAGWQQND